MYSYSPIFEIWIRSTKTVELAIRKQHMEKPSDNLSCLPKLPRQITWVVKQLGYLAI